MTLKEAGFKVGTVQEFLGLSDSEMEEIEARLKGRKKMTKITELDNLEVGTIFSKPEEPSQYYKKGTTIKGVGPESQTLCEPKLGNVFQPKLAEWFHNRFKVRVDS